MGDVAVTPDRLRSSSFVEVFLADKGFANGFNVAQFRLRIGESPIAENQ